MARAEWLLLLLLWLLLRGRLLRFLLRAQGSLSVLQAQLLLRGRLRLACCLLQGRLYWALTLQQSQLHSLLLGLGALWLRERAPCLWHPAPLLLLPPLLF